MKMKSFKCYWLTKEEPTFHRFRCIDELLADVVYNDVTNILKSVEKVTTYRLVESISLNERVCVFESDNIKEVEEYIKKVYSDYYIYALSIVFDG